MTSQLRVLLGALLAAALLAAVVPTANAATGPRPLSPKSGKVFSKGAFLTFKVKDTSAAARKYGIFMVIANRKRTKSGQLQKSKNGRRYSIQRGGDPGRIAANMDA